jgi:glutamate racemase
VNGIPQTTIGVFDSGVGGLSVLREIVRQLNHQDVLYFADSAHVPYGQREAEEILSFSTAITSFLVDRGAAIIVVACNTASAAALQPLRARFELPIVGMEPAVKPAVEHSHSRHVGVIATEVTFQGELFARLVERFARDTIVHTQACPGLVERVEAGRIDEADTKSLVVKYLDPMLAAGIDSLVLGCTHYSFLLPIIREVVGPSVQIIDPAPAVARQTGRVLALQGIPAAQREGRVSFFTSGDRSTFSARMRRLVTIPGPVHSVRWAQDPGRFLLLD